MLKFGVLQLFIEVEHLRDECDHAVVTGFVHRIGEVDGAEGGGEGMLIPISSICQ